MNRFAVFAWSWYYPTGGFNDYHASYATEGEARAHLTGCLDSMMDGQVVDLTTGTAVCYGTRDSGGPAKLTDGANA